MPKCSGNLFEMTVSQKLKDNKSDNASSKIVNSKNIKAKYDKNDYFWENKSYIEEELIEENKGKLPQKIKIKK